MKYTVILSTKAIKQLHKLDRSVQERLLKALERIRIRPKSFIEKLVSSDLFRLRVGKYRIIMDIDQNILYIFVIEIGHRKVIYKPKT